MLFKAIICDLDGTLLDTLQDLTLSVNAVLERHGFPRHTADAYRLFIGDGIEMLLRRALPAGREVEGACMAAPVEEMVEAFREEYRRRWADHTLPYPGIAELLDHLQEREIPKAILSNKPHEATVKMVERLLPSWDFAAVWGARKGVANKPDPASALDLARKIRVKPEEVVFLGDSAVDMKTAAAAGMFPAGALWGFRDAAELSAAGAALLAAKPGEIIPLFS